MTPVSDSVNRGMSTAKRMYASLYDWIVYKRGYKARERKGERKTDSIVGSYKYLRRAAKALVVSEPMATWQNIAEVLYNPFVT